MVLVLTTVLKNCLKFQASEGILRKVQSSAPCGEIFIFLQVWRSNSPSLEIMEFRTSLPNNTNLPVLADIINIDVPLLIGLDNLDSHQLLAQNLKNKRVHHNWEPPLLRHNGHLFLQWNCQEILFTKSELYHVHRNFFHPGATKLSNVLKRGYPKECLSDALKSLQSISANCLPCQQKLTPRRFKLSLPDEKTVFNGVVAIDLTWLNANTDQMKKTPILHIIDTHIDFQNAEYPKGESARHVCDDFIEHWSAVYIGYPQKLKTDHGSIFTSKKLQMDKHGRYILEDKRNRVTQFQWINRTIP